MALEERLGECAKPIAQMCGRVVVVMKVHLDAAVALMAKSGERVEQLGTVVLFGEKERVLGRSSIRVSEPLSEAWISVNPCGDTRTFGIEIRCAVGRFEMVGDAEEYVDWPAMVPASKEPLGPRIEKARQPELSVSRE